jgi:hypothetical protein
MTTLAAHLSQVLLPCVATGAGASARPDLLHYNRGALADVTAESVLQEWQRTAEGGWALASYLADHFE